MSSSIWKTPDQKPGQDQQVLFFAGGGSFPYLGFYYKRFDTFQDWESKHVQKWCDIDDLIAQADKAERLQKQLDRAKWWLKEIVENHRYTPITTAEMALKELDDEQ